MGLEINNCVNFVLEGEYMSRFSEFERVEIKKTLMHEGERLFSDFGLKKVTVDDIVEAVNISKGSFYAFYQNKEHLFIEINYNLQTRLYKEVQTELKNIHELSSSEQLFFGLRSLLNGFMDHPILMNVDINTWASLRRKLPADFFCSHTLDDSKMLETIFGSKVKLTESFSLLAKLLQVILQSLGMLKNDPDYNHISDIIIKGIVQQIVVDEKLN